MEIEKKYYKLKICNFYKKGKCNKNNLCTYAHGLSELREYKKDCKFGINCLNKECNFYHPKNWNYMKNNKKDEENIIFVQKEVLKNDNDFPALMINNDNYIKTNDNIYKKPKVLFADIIKNDKKNVKDNNNINQDKLDVETQTINIKNKIQNKYKELSNIDEKNWENDFEIREIEDEIETLKLEYDKLNTVNKKVNYYEEFDDLNLNNIFNLDIENSNNEIMKNIDYGKEDKIENNPNINITINGFNICKNVNDEFNIYEYNEINKIIDNMEMDIENYINKIKEIINKQINFKKDIKIELIKNLNGMKSNVELFRNNYNDLLKYNFV